MFYKFDLSFSTYETLGVESMKIIDSHKWIVEEYQQSDGSIISSISFHNKKIFSYGTHFYN